MAIIKTIYLHLSNVLSFLLFNSTRLFYKPAPKTRKYIKELKEDVKKTAISSKPQTTRSEWEENLNRLYQYLYNNNPLYFLHSKVVRDTMFTGNAYYVVSEYFYLKNNNWKIWKNIIKENNKIPNEPFILYPRSSGNTIHHTYHLARFQNDTGVDYKKLKVIFEFGGGYGNMCRIFKKLGFKGTYIIYDLPIFSALQSFYLKVNNIPAVYNKINYASKVMCISDYTKLTKLLKKYTRGKDKLFLATWSLSESPLVTRRLIEPLVSRFEYFLISYQSNFNDIDNISYFKKFQNKFVDYKWFNYKIEQLPNNNYLFGKRI